MQHFQVLEVEACAWWFWTMLPSSGAGSGLSFGYMARFSYTGPMPELWCSAKERVPRQYWRGCNLGSDSLRLHERRASRATVHSLT